jgi:hypothetical protein
MKNFLFILLFLFQIKIGYASISLESTPKINRHFEVIKNKMKEKVSEYTKLHSMNFYYSDGSVREEISYDEKASNLLLIHNGRKYYSHINQFVDKMKPSVTCDPNNKENPTLSYCDWISTRYLTCHLYIFDENIDLANTQILDITRSEMLIKGNPRCTSLKAMSVAKEIPDAMLITLGYTDSAEPADPHNEPPEFVTTVLLRFSEENGKLKIEQDDACLGNPNHYNTIAKAREALRLCTKNGLDKK